MSGTGGNIKKRYLLLGLLGLVVCVAAFGLITVITPMVGDPVLVASTLGVIAGLGGAAGCCFLLLAIFKKNPEP
ncbi:hypothetical protein [uncultured Litoreibacter sp.]|uniref:hypothetical protein n=1 Tax=uncultured Litoreibacter sp. TaxID=1392394 RepID=UPI002602EF00|nr:hypothetical protein [uncultured Litoreibacter sp.]